MDRPADTQNGAQHQLHPNLGNDEKIDNCCICQSVKEKTTRMTTTTMMIHQSASPIMPRVLMQRQQEDMSSHEDRPVDDDSVCE